MPQMAPLMWTILFIFFTASLLVAMIKISFAKAKTQPAMEVLPLSAMKSKMNWKW